uniref:Ig-like domain-containing protein n=1 Tax=Castor canadensis TaxID=51338 RepID=A0A8C0WG33_CASCN
GVHLPNTCTFPVLTLTHIHLLTTEGEVTLSEGAPLTMNCSYETTQYPSLYWYVQYPGEGLQLLFRVTRDGEKGSHKGFEATYSRKSTSFHLEKASVHESDTAVYYCVLSDTVAETTGGASRVTVRTQ